MVEATPTTGKPSRASDAEPGWEPFPPTSRAARRSRTPATTPAKPLRTPNTSQPLASAPRVTARTAAFIPGASPPLVSTAIFFKPDILKLDGQITEAAARGSARVPGLPAMGERDPDGVRRRRSPCKSHAGRRAARRRGRQEGPAFLVFLVA